MRSVVIPVSNVNVQLIAEGDVIARMMSNGKAWEPQTREAWSWLVVHGCQADGMVLDVGAYTGVYAIAAALMGRRVMALEPHPTNCARMLMNAALNSMRFEVMTFAASDVSSVRALYTNKPIDVMSDTATLLDDEPGMYGTEVLTTRVDDLPLACRVGLMKIDVEHHEVEVLDGARGVLAACKPIVVVETLNTPAFDRVAMLLHVCGYKHVTTLDKRNAVYEARP